MIHLFQKEVPTEIQVCNALRKLFQFGLTLIRDWSQYPSQSTRSFSNSGFLWSSGRISFQHRLCLLLTFFNKKTLRQFACTKMRDKSSFTTATRRAFTLFNISLRVHGSSQLLGNIFSGHLIIVIIDVLYKKSVSSCHWTNNLFSLQSCVQAL